MVAVSIFSLVPGLYASRSFFICSRPAAAEPVVSLGTLGTFARLPASALVRMFEYSELMKMPL